MTLRGFLPLLLLSFGLSAEARVFQNSYLQFDLPDTWACKQEGAAWVCAPTNKGDAREALIVSTAKLAGPEDNLVKYYNHLRQPKTLVGKGSSSLSQPLSIKKEKMGNQEWVYAIHNGSEVPNFKTRYLATVKQKIALLLSFSADRDVEGKYDAIFDRAIKSLRVDASKPIVMKPVSEQVNDPKSVIGNSQELPPPPITIQADNAAGKQKKLVFYGLIALAAVGVLLAIRKLV